MSWEGRVYPPPVDSPVTSRPTRRRPRWHPDGGHSVILRPRVSVGPFRPGGSERGRSVLCPEPPTGLRRVHFDTPGGDGRYGSARSLREGRGSTEGRRRLWKVSTFVPSVLVVKLGVPEDWGPSQNEVLGSAVDFCGVPVPGWVSRGPPRGPLRDVSVLSPLAGRQGSLLVWH